MGSRAGDERVEADGWKSAGEGQSNLWLGVDPEDRKSSGGRRKSTRGELFRDFHGVWPSAQGAARPSRLYTRALHEPPRLLAPSLPQGAGSSPCGGAGTAGLNYEELWTVTGASAMGLGRKGIGKGDRVALFLARGEFVVAYLCWSGAGGGPGGRSTLPYACEISKCWGTTRQSC